MELIEPTFIRFVESAPAVVQRVDLKETAFPSDSSRHIEIPESFVCSGVGRIKCDSQIIGKRRILCGCSRFVVIDRVYLSLLFLG